MNQRELLTALDDLASRQTRTKEMPNETERLLRLAAAEIRQLSARLNAVHTRPTWLADMDNESEAGL